MMYKYIDEYACMPYQKDIDSIMNKFDFGLLVRMLKSIYPEQDTSVDSLQKELVQLLKFTISFHMSVEQGEQITYESSTYFHSSFYMEDENLYSLNASFSPIHHKVDKFADRLRKRFENVPNVVFSKDI